MHAESLVNSSFSSTVDLNSNSNPSRNSPIISVGVSALQKERVGETLLLRVSTSICSTDTSFSESASKSLSVQEFEVASELYRIHIFQFLLQGKIDGR